MKRLTIIFVFFNFGIALAAGGAATDSLKKYYEDKNYDKAAAFVPDALKENQKDWRFAESCGDIYFELEKYPNALQTYLVADDIKSYQTSVMRKIGRTYSIMGKHKEAINILIKATKEDEKDAYNYLELANAYTRADSLTKAELNIQRAKEINKKIPDAAIAMGDLYFKQRVYELAKSNYEDALALNENLIEARSKLATSYYWLAQREIDEALRKELFTRSLNEWNKVTKQDPKNSKAFFEQGKILFFSGLYTDAANSLHQFVTLRPSGSLGRWYLAQSLYEIGACDSAAPQLDIVSRDTLMDSVRIKSKFMMARCYFDKKYWQKSTTAFEDLIKTEKLEEEDMRRFATAYLNAGDSTKAFNIFEQSINMYPDKSCRMMYNLAIMYFSKKKYDNSVNMFNKRLATAICKDSLEAKIYYFIGLAKFFSVPPDSVNTVKLGEARDAFTTSLSMDSLNLETRLYLADAISALKDYEEAEFQFNLIISRGMADTIANGKVLKSAFQKKCGVYYDKKNYSALIKTGTDWSNLFLNDALAYLYMGIGYQGQEDIANACKNYKKVIKLDPKNGPAKKLIKGLNCD
ncbi:MAG: hypothetical protein HW421_3551 [Ignavibacteria bacterium]|nr:hypothetical protein [Ignavibacteria bacterium]